MSGYSGPRFAARSPRRQPTAGAIRIRTTRVLRSPASNEALVCAYALLEESEVKAILRGQGRSELDRYHALARAVRLDAPRAYPYRRSP